jgi:hypothetical protein
MEIELSAYGEILVIDNLLSAEECQDFCKNIDTLIEGGYAYESNNLINRQDEGVHFAELASLKTVGLISSANTKAFLDRLHNAVLPEYLSRFPILTQRDLWSMDVKGQRTSPGGGFHGWHYECERGLSMDRVLAWTLYLNGDFEGGETEFLYQNMRITPVTGRFAVFPAGFLHTHRGNPPIKGTKYILTGWFTDVNPYDILRA